jgi:hypothetical protein
MIYIERTEVALDKAPLVLWDNIFLDGTVAASTEATDAPVENALTDSTWDYWQPTTTSGTVTLTLAGTASALGIAAHDLGTQGATINVKADGVSVLDSTVSPADDTPILILFDSTTSATNWSVEITGASAAFSIGNMVLGVPLVFESGVVPSYTPLYMADNVELLMNQSLGGQFFQNRVIRKSAETSIQLNILERSFIEGATFQNFRDYYNDGKTFYWAAGPSVFEKDVAFCRRTNGGELKPTFENTGIFYRVGLQLEAYIG